MRKKLIMKKNGKEEQTSYKEHRNSCWCYVKVILSLEICQPLSRQEELWNNSSSQIELVYLKCQWTQSNKSR